MRNLLGRALAMVALPGFLLPGLGGAQVSAPTAAAPPVAEPLTSTPGDLPRLETLKELGFAGGLVLRGMSAQQPLFFPVGAPQAVNGMVLSLPYRTASAFQARRSLEAWVNDRPVTTQALPMEPANGVINIPVSPADIKNGYLLVTLKYAGVSTEDRCIDERAAGDFVTFPATDGLMLSLGPEALNEVQSVSAFAPQDVRFVMPAANLTAAQVAAALSVAAGAKGRLTFATVPAEIAGHGAWTQTNVFVGQGRAPVSVIPGAPGTPPALALGGDDPAAGGRLLATIWAGLAKADTMGGAVAGAAVRDRKISLRGLGADVTPRDVVGRADWTANFSRKVFPAGTHPGSIDLQVIAPPDQSGGSIVSASLNGQVIASARASWPGTTSLTATLPKGLVTLDNSLIVSVLRQPRGGDCKFAPQGYPAQLMGASALLLDADKGPLTDFNNLTSPFGQGLTVRLPANDAATLGWAMPLAALAVQRLAPAGAPIKVSFGDAPLDGPFIAIGMNAPAGSKPPVRFDSGRVQLSTSEGRALFDLAGLNKLTTAQLVSSGAFSGVWLRAGPQSTPPDSLELDRGDVAFIDKSGVNMAFSSTRDDLIDVRYPDQIGILGWLGQHRVWVILAVWIAVTLGFLIFLQRLYRNRKR